MLHAIPEKVRIFLTGLGFSTEETIIYTALLHRGILTILEISRITGISRTQVYRLLEDMEKKRLVEEVVDEHRVMLKAVEIRELKHLMEEKQTEAETLKRLFPEVEELLSAQMVLGETGTRVQFYRGVNGLKQMVWHTLRAEKEVVGYTYRDITEITGEDFMSDWAEAFIRKQLIFRDIISDHFFPSKLKTGRMTKLPSSVNQLRYIRAEKLDVRIQMDIYNDVVAHYNWHEGEVFGVEMYNNKIASFHRQLFEIAWQQAKPVK